MHNPSPDDEDLRSRNRRLYGSVIREARLRQGLQQPQLARMLGVHKNYISNWESGVSRPDLSIIPALCGALRLSLAEFFRQPEEAGQVSPRDGDFLRRCHQLNARDRQLLETFLDDMLTAEQDEAWQRCRELYICCSSNEQGAAAGVSAPLDAAAAHPVYVRRNRFSLHADEIISVSGDSMEPLYGDRQEVYVQHCAELRLGEIGIFVVNGEGFIKQYGGGVLHSLNPRRADIILHPDDDVRLVGRVLGPVDPGDYPTLEDQAILDEIGPEGLSRD